MYVFLYGLSGFRAWRGRCDANGVFGVLGLFFVDKVYMFRQTVPARKGLVTEFTLPSWSLLVMNSQMPLQIVVARELQLTDVTLELAHY